MKFKNLLLGVLVISGACVASSVAMSSSFERGAPDWNELNSGLNIVETKALLNDWKMAGNRFLTGFEFTEEFLRNPLFMVQLIIMTRDESFVHRANNMIGEWLGSAIVYDMPWDLKKAHRFANVPLFHVASASRRCLRKFFENDQPARFDDALNQAGAQATSSAGVSPVAQPKVHKPGLRPHCLAYNN